MDSNLNLGKPLQKAYKIDFDRIREGYLYCERSCYASNRNKAKSILLGQLKKDYEILIPKGTDREVNYITIPIKRYPEADKYQFEDKILTLCQIRDLLQERERVKELENILKDDSIQVCYIRKGGYYYRPKFSGYTEYRISAGVYTKQEAVECARSAREISIVTINVKEHNGMIEKEIRELKNKLVKPKKRFQWLFS